MAALTEVQHGQQQFLMRGGTYELPLQRMRKEGLIDSEYVFREYPKLLRINPREVTKSRAMDYCDGRKEVVLETRTIYDDIVVNSEEEEERVLSGGQTTSQMEEARQGLLIRCRANGIPADPSWSAVRLRRELGDALDAPAPTDNMAKLEAELTTLRRMASMQAEIDALRAQMARPAEDPEMLRSELTALGVKVDGRWSVARMRDELDRATAPAEGG